MKRIILALMLALGVGTIAAEEISNIETTSSWVYLYNSKGKKYKTLHASSIGTIVGYSSSFFVSQSGSWIYLYDADGKRYKTLHKSSVGEVIGVAGDTFTSRSGSWIYTWDKNGKKISTRHVH